MFSVSLPEIEFGSVFAGPDSKHQTQNATLFSLIQYIKWNDKLPPNIVQDSLFQLMF